MLSSGSASVSKKLKQSVDGRRHAVDGQEEGIPRLKFQIPSTKFQINSIFQFPKRKPFQLFFLLLPFYF
jgi:hypothetical protein